MTSVAFKTTVQRVPKPSKGWCVIKVEELESAAGLLLAGSEGSTSTDKAVRCVATSGVIMLPNGVMVEHDALPGDILFPAPRTEATPPHQLAADGCQLMRLLDIAGYIEDERGRDRARAKAAGLHVAEAGHASH